ncbi:MAG: hypothetical protein ACK50A_00375 [Sphingobacteriaceae bacterium]
MAKITLRSKIKKLPENIAAVDLKTAEIMPTEGNIYTISNSDKMYVSYDNYLSLNLDCLGVVLSKGIKQVDLGMLISICSNLLTNENICLQANNEPHTAESVSRIIGQTEQAAKKKLNNLVKMDLLNYSYAIVGYKKRKVYRVNPHLMKKGLNMNAQLAPMFSDLTSGSILKAALESTHIIPTGEL